MAVRRFTLILASGLVAALASQARADGSLSAADIKKLVPGRYHVEVAPGVAVDVALAAGGGISGVTNKGDKDAGRWRMAGSRMCVTFKRWLDHKERCSVLANENGQIKGDGFYAKRL